MTWPGLYYPWIIRVHEGRAEFYPVELRNLRVSGQVNGSKHEGLILGVLEQVFGMRGERNLIAKQIVRHPYVAEAMGMNFSFPIYVVPDRRGMYVFVPEPNKWLFADVVRATPIKERITSKLLQYGEITDLPVVPMSGMWIYMDLCNGPARI